MSPPPPVSYPNTAAAMRQRFLGRPAKLPRKHVLQSGAPVWMKACTLAVRNRCMDGAGVTPGKEPTLEQMTRASALTAIALASDEEGRTMFSPTDLDRLLDSEVGEEEAEIVELAGAALGGDKKVGEASGEAATSASPTSSPAS